MLRGSRKKGAQRKVRKCLSSYANLPSSIVNDRRLNASVLRQRTCGKSREIASSLLISPWAPENRCLWILRKSHNEAATQGQGQRPQARAPTLYVGNRFPRLQVFSLTTAPGCRGCRNAKAGPFARHRTCFVSTDRPGTVPISPFLPS